MTVSVSFGKKQSTSKFNPIFFILIEKEAKSKTMENSTRKNVSVITVQSTSNDGYKIENPARKWTFAFAFRPMYYLMRVCSFMPFTIIYDTVGEVLKPRVTALDILWLLISLCNYLMALYCTKVFYTKFKQHKPPNVTKTSILVNEFFYMSEVIFGMSSIIIDLCNRFKLNDILRKFDQFDKEVNE